MHFWDIGALYNGRHFADGIFKRISFISDFNEIIQWSILAIIQHQDGLALNRRQAIIWNNDRLVYWYMNDAFGLNGLTHTVCY